VGEYIPPNGANVNLDLAGEYTPDQPTNIRLAFAPPSQYFQQTSWAILRKESQPTAWKIVHRESRETAWAVLHVEPIKPGLYAFTDVPYAAKPKLQAEIEGEFRNPPRRQAEPEPGWNDPEKIRAEVQGDWEGSAPKRNSVEITLQEFSQRFGGEHSANWQTPANRRAEKDLPWDFFQTLRQEPELDYRDPAKRRLEAESPWGETAKLKVELDSGFTDPPQKRTSLVLPWDQFRHIRWEERWKKSLEQYFSWRVGAPDGENYYPASGAAANLPLRCKLLDWPGYAVWLFIRQYQCANAQRVWKIVNQISVVRLSDSTPVPVLGVSLTSDYDSWCWGLSMTLPDRAALDLVSPVGGSPVEVEITINGYVWTAVVESFEERRSFGKGRNGYVVTGRSRSAELAAPRALTRSYTAASDLTAVQLAEAELTPYGWTLDWSPPDWLVPAGAFAYRDLAPLEAAGLTAAAVGAKFQSDRENKILYALPRYPLSPWAWDAATPDATLTSNLIDMLSLRWEEEPGWNGVYVSGQNQGVLVNVKRTGSDGTPVSPMIVDPLITHVDAGRERGRIILSGGGKKARVAVELPLLPLGENPGLLAVGQLAEVQDGVETWRGLVTGVSIETQRPRVRQRIELERHY